MIANGCNILRIRNCALNLFHVASCREIRRRTVFMNRLIRCWVQCSVGAVAPLFWSTAADMSLSSLMKVEMRLRRLRSDRQEAHLFADSGGSAKQTYPFGSATQQLSCCYKSLRNGCDQCLAKLKD